MTENRGQITILVLLLGLLGLTVSLSAASRSLSDLKQTTVVDSGTKALAAAEAGVQYGLTQLGAASCTPTPINYNLPGIKPYAGDPNTTGVTYEICPSNEDYTVASAVGADDVVQIDLSKIHESNVKHFKVVWKNPASSVEVIYVDSTNQLSRYLYYGATAISGFASPLLASSCISSLCADATFGGGYCIGSGSLPADKFYSGDKLLRVRPLYAPTDIAICSDAAGGSPGRLAIEYTTVIATARSVDGTTRKVQITLSPSVLPSVFDNVIFSGGNLTK